MKMVRIFSAFVITFFMHACDCGAKTVDLPRDGGSDGNILDTGNQDGQRGDTSSKPITALRVEPADVVLSLALGATDTQDYVAIATFSDNSEGPAPNAQFTIDSRNAGEIDINSGRFTANGRSGGTYEVRASAGGQVATTSLTIKLSSVSNPGGVTPQEIDDFDTLPPEAGQTHPLLYPLDGAVMPNNVFQPDVQWEEAMLGDVYRIRFTKPSATVTHYLKVDDAFDDRHLLIDNDEWRAILETDVDDALMISVDRVRSGKLVLGEPVTLTIAKGALLGTVYYWDIAAGRIKSINDGENVATSFMPTPPLDRTGNANCVGCHRVSNSGRYMAGRLGGGWNIGAVFDLTKDLTGDPPPVEFELKAPTTGRNGGNPGDGSARWTFSDWSPDDKHMVITNDIEGGDRAMKILDPLTGEFAATAGTAPTDGSQPEWSPDGTQVAYVSGRNAWGGSFSTGDISIVDMVSQTEFGSVATIFDSSARGAGSSASYPTWAPDSEHIAFSYGTGTRSEWHYAELYWMNRDGSQEVKLTKANDGYDEVYQPRFSPFEEGGYFWLSFLSTRPYGNDAHGTTAQVNVAYQYRDNQNRLRAGRAAIPVEDVPAAQMTNIVNGVAVENIIKIAPFHQIWVTAIKVDTPAGSDPSNTPYWLPGQATSSMNISADWAPRACRENLEVCTANSECCSGQCLPDGVGGLVCSPPPPEACRVQNETCSEDGDCCEGLGLTCRNNACVGAIVD